MTPPEGASPAKSVGVVLVGHGETASHLLRAAQGIAAPGSLDGVVALDAGPGDSDSFTAAMCEALDRVDGGQGVLLLVDLLGASPCQCGHREGKTHHVVVLSGLNLAMLLKLSSLDRASSTAEELAEACACSAQRSVCVSPAPPSPPQPADS
ncbi:MAG: PTS sugar transporter subunit IIA [Nannocystales bacterium]